MLSPTIVGSIKKHYVRKQFFEAAKRELTELQFQLCITGMLLAQRFGELDRDYLNQAKSILDTYNGGEKPQSIITFIESMLGSTDEEFAAMAAYLRAEDGVGLSLKSHSTILIDSNAAQVSELPIDLQSKVYEFKNALNIYNQEVAMAKNSLDRTYDSTLTDINHQRLSDGLAAKYADLQGVCTRVCGKIQGILDHEL